MRIVLQLVTGGKRLKKDGSVGYAVIGMKFIAVKNNAKKNKTSD